MSDLSWFASFAVVALIMIVVSGWMAWFSRRAMKAHKSQMEDMVLEMRKIIDKGDQELPPES
tara:strand:- start:94 stop:279 length:186 start_codon:yes stop_codon:yes gene_type:complete